MTARIFLPFPVAPCPYCWSAAEVHEIRAGGARAYQVRCGSCGCSGPRSPEVSECIRAWTDGPDGTVVLRPYDRGLDAADSQIAYLQGVLERDGRFVSAMGSVGTVSKFSDFARPRIPMRAEDLLVRVFR